MRTLDEHEASQNSLYWRDHPIYPRPNGIACDQCGHELQDTNGQHLTSLPPKTAVQCPQCGFRGYRTL